MKVKINREKGQVVLMVLLASALILTLGLSASKITTTETQIDTDQELLKKAFNVAESGIDYYLSTGETTYKAGNEMADLKVNNLGEQKELSFNSMILVGNQEYYWLVNHNDDGSIGSSYYSDANSTIDICSIDGKADVLKIDYFYLTGATYGVGRTVVNVTTDGDGDDNCFKNFDLSASGVKKSLLLTVMPVDNNTKLKLVGANNFPIQGEEISATGKAEGVNNTVTILNRYETFLTEAIVAGGDVTSSE